VDVPSDVAYRLSHGPASRREDVWRLFRSAEVARGRDPFLILCAGHGGCGTLASVDALRFQGKIAAQLSTEGDRAIELVRVNRWKPEGSPLEVDDLDGSDWSFAWEFGEDD